MGKKDKNRKAMAAAQHDRKAHNAMRGAAGKARNRRAYGDAQWKRDLEQFNAQLRAQGMRVKDVAGDGNCMFRAICDQMQGDPNNHATFRRQICDYMQANRDNFEPFFMGEDERVESFDDYLTSMRRVRSCLECCHFVLVSSWFHL